MSNPLIIKIFWTSFDFVSDAFEYYKDIAVGGVLDIECFDFLKPPKV